MSENINGRRSGKNESPKLTLNWENLGWMTSHRQYENLEEGRKVRRSVSYNLSFEFLFSFIHFFIFAVNWRYPAQAWLMRILYIVRGTLEKLWFVRFLLSRKSRHSIKLLNRVQEFYEISCCCEQKEQGEKSYWIKSLMELKRLKKFIIV